MADDALTPAQMLGRAGGQATHRRYGSEHMRQIGRRGGRTHSWQHMAKISRKGGAAYREGMTDEDFREDDAKRRHIS